ncbi:hypothetical protein [Candidatus Tisiphia endosymbiont of Hybos culiciformis]|uniref:hypothetical protein n=1 Tax=Candidatus Tisiphia endosymbiont of Hybos culiciformis TaxID=3139331 RepID=UPI003CCB71A2
MLRRLTPSRNDEIALPPELLGKPVPPITVPKDIPPSNKPVAESTEFKWTEEAMASLLAASHANKVIPHGGLMNRR